MLAAFAAIPRERFVAPRLRERAHLNAPLPIGCQQTISQPQVIARMLDLLALRPDDRVLDVGTGSGYHAALLATLAGQVVSIERHRKLSESAAPRLRALGIDNVLLLVGDGSRGAPEHAPFDAINVAAAVPAAVPEPLLAALAEGGRLVAPVALDPSRPDDQRLLLVRRVGGALTQRLLEPVRFVPLVRDLPD